MDWSILILTIVSIVSGTTRDQVLASVWDVLAILNTRVVLLLLPLSPLQSSKLWELGNLLDHQGF